MKEIDVEDLKKSSPEGTSLNQMLRDEVMYADVFFHEWISDGRCTWETKGGIVG